ncbi:MAG: ABC transporter ATP-binding protein [Nevskiales bacterium]
MLLDVSRLSISYHTRDGLVEAVKDLSFQLNEGETLGVVGESGSGKTQAAMAIMGVLDRNAEVSGSVRWEGQELVGARATVLNNIRGDQIAMIFQDPMTSLNPHLRIRTQMTEVLREHKNMNEKQAQQRAIEMLQAVKIPDAARRIEQYPHEFSGGMRQRVMIATSLLCEPKLLIADEPTTALDVTVQAEILRLIRELRTRMGTALILITHDMGVVAGNCERVLVMHEGALQESGTAEEIFYNPRRPYTQRLLAAVQRLEPIQ